MSLILHRGAHEVSIDQLRLAPMPQATRSYVPVGHYDLLEQVRTSLMGVGFRIQEETHGMVPDGSRYFGLMQIATGSFNGTAVERTGYGLTVGIRNSHDKKFPASLAVGSRVFVCDNLAFSAEVTISRRHTVNIHRDLPNLIQNAVGRIGKMRVRQEERFLAYQQTPIEDKEADHFIIQAMRNRVIPVTYIQDVVKEWYEPSHPEFDQSNLWRLFNAFTEVNKEVEPTALLKRTMALHGMCDAVSGFGSGPVTIDAEAA